MQKTNSFDRFNFAGDRVQSSSRRIAVPSIPYRSYGQWSRTSDPGEVEDHEMKRGFSPYPWYPQGRSSERVRS